MTYALHRHTLGCGCGMNGLGTTSTMTEATRAALRTKLNDAMRDYTAQASQVRRLISGTAFNAAKFGSALEAVRRGGSAAAVQLSREQLANLILGTFAKVEEVLKRATAVIVATNDARDSAIADNAILVARRAMARLSQLSGAVRAVQSVSGLGSLGQSAGEMGAGLAAVVGLLLVSTGVGLVPGLVLLGGGVGYLLAQSNSEMDQALAQTDEAMRRVRDACSGSADYERCRQEYLQTLSVIAEQQRRAGIQGLVQEMGTQAQGIVRAGGEAGSAPLTAFFGQLGQGAKVVLIGGGVAVGGYLLYLTWPLLTGGRRVAERVSRISRNGRRRRRSRRSR